MALPNADARQYWNEDGGLRWVRKEQQYERQLSVYVDPLMAAAGLEPGQLVLDVGCGAGPTTRAAARRVGPAGRVVGADFSAPLLESARGRTSEAGIENVDYVETDAQVAPFAELVGGRSDRVISRLGVMFFEDPVAAFANIRAGLTDAGCLAFVCFRGVEVNEWMRVPGEALARGYGVDFVQPGDGPGPFSLADPDRIGSVLDQAGYRGVGLTSYDAPIALGGGCGATEAADFVADAAMQFVDVDPEDRGPAVGWIAEALALYENDDGQVSLRSGVWIVTAQR